MAPKIKKPAENSRFLGKYAPDFKLKDQDGNFHSLKNYANRIILLYFYPKDMTPGCTIEAEGFRDNFDELKKLGVVVLGVSADSESSHKKFCDKHKLNFPLLSDEKKEIIKKYGAWVKKSMYGKEYMGISRESFLIGKDGKIIKHYQKVNPDNHPEEVLRDVIRNQHTISSIQE